MLLILGLALAAGACSEKGAELFEPPLLDPTQLPDQTEPVIRDFDPAPGTVWGGDVFRFQVEDVGGQADGPPSGVDPESVRVLNAAELPVSPVADGFEASLDGVADGVHDFTVTASDHAGNEATAEYPMTVDRTQPELTLGESPMDGTVFGAVGSFTFTGTVQDAHPGEYTLKLGLPGPDEACGTDDDLAFGAERVEANPIDLAPLVAEDGAFEVTYEVANPTTSDEPEVSERHCAVFNVSDAVEPSPNTLREAVGTTVTWRRRDVDPPVISAVEPGLDIAVYGGNTIRFRAVDAESTNGASPSGVDAASVRVFDGAELAVTPLGEGAFAASLGGLADGSHEFTILVDDQEGNRALETVAFSLDRTPPELTLTEQPEAETATTAETLERTYAGQVTDTHPGTFTLRIRDPGPDGACGTADDAPVDGLDPASFDLGSDVGGEFSVTYTLPSPATPTDPEVSRSYCALFGLEDTAEPTANTTMTARRSTVLWSTATTGAVTGTLTVDGSGFAGATVTIAGAATTTAEDGTFAIAGLAPGDYTVVLSGLPEDPYECDARSKAVTVTAGTTTTVDFNCGSGYQLGFAATFRNSEAGSRICWNVATSPEQPAATGSYLFSGPGVAAGQEAAAFTLDASGTASGGIDITAEGTYQYEVSVTSNGVTRTAEGSLEVTAEAGSGSC